MSPAWIQLWVERRAVDPAASTAGHTLQLLLGRDAPVRVGRADLWELRADDAGAGARESFETWMRASNLFLNPNRDRGVLLEGVAPVPGASAAAVVTVERGGGDSRAHALTLGHALGGKWRVRRGTVWTLLWPEERVADVAALAERAAWARRRSSGLLVNPESQDAVVLVGRWACPALPDANGGASNTLDHGGSDGGVA
ncbi:MAG: hypothetical protein ABI960_09740 [Candidatus Eisenbacteria bacterium]